MNSFYTYRIKWSQLGVSYYGCRTAKTANPSDLWVKYFTSSNAVKKFRKMYGEPDIIQVRKTFSSGYAAYDWESRVLKRLKVKTTHLWLNQSDNSGFVGIYKRPGRPKGLVNCRNTITGELEVVHTNDPRIKTGELINNTAGTKTVFDTLDNKYVRIPVNCLDSRYVSMNKGFVVVYCKETSTHIRIQKETFDPKLHTHLVDMYERKPMSHENRMEISKRMKGENNPRFGKPGTFTGRTHSKETIEKIKLAKKLNPPVGNKNPNFGKKRPGMRWFNDGQSEMLINPSSDHPFLTNPNVVLGRLKK